MEYRCWIPDHAEVEDAKNYVALDPSGAAEKHVQFDWSCLDGWEVDMEHPRIVHVLDEHGTLTKWSVTGELGNPAWSASEAPNDD